MLLLNGRFGIRHVNTLKAFFILCKICDRLQFYIILKFHFIVSLLSTVTKEWAAKLLAIYAEWSWSFIYHQTV